MTGATEVVPAGTQSPTRSGLYFSAHVGKRKQQSSPRSRYARSICKRTRSLRCRYDDFMPHEPDPSQVSGGGQGGPASGQSDFDEALDKLKRISKSVRVGGQARTGPTDQAPAADSEERMRRLEERLAAVEEALHALQAKLSA